MSTLPPNPFQRAEDRDDGRRKPNPANAGYLHALRADVPGCPVDNPLLQAQEYTGIPYLCIKLLSRLMAGSEIILEKPRKKSVSAAPTGKRSDEKWVQVTGHPLCQLLQRPNPRDTLNRFTTRLLIQKYLTGRRLVWGPRNAAGKPGQLWVLPTALCWPVPPSAEYPLGAWRVNPSYPSGTMGWVGGPGGASMAGAIIDRREVYEDRDPHPVHDWAPYSPLVGGAFQVDIIEAIDRGLWSAMDRGVSPDGVLLAPGVSVDQVTFIVENSAFFNTVDVALDA